MYRFLLRFGLQNRQPEALVRYQKRTGVPGHLLCAGQQLVQRDSFRVFPPVRMSYKYLSSRIISSRISCQSGIGVRAIRMTARIAPTNAAAPMTANTFLLSFFFAALQISAAQAMQTAAVYLIQSPVPNQHTEGWLLLQGILQLFSAAFSCAGRTACRTSYSATRSKSVVCAII